jgi:CubicO group peptidase (beta-lactamase class C family)
MPAARFIAAVLIFGIPTAALGAGNPLPAAFNAYIQPYVETNNFSGAVLVARGGQILFERAYGVANAAAERRNTKTTCFHIASMSMQFTAAGVLRLIKEGKLTLDTRVDDIVPAIPNGDKITIRHLMEETSGLPDVNAFPDYGQILKQHQTPGSLVQLIRNKEPRAAPGDPSTSEEHSAFNLLALITEKLTKMSFAEAQQHLVFKRLGMANSGIDHDQELPAACALGYAPVGVRDLELAQQIQWSAKTGNASAYSTVGDEMKWVRGLFERQFLNEQLRAALLDYSTSHVGYGWFKSVNKRLGVSVYSMNGRAPGFASFLAYIPSERLTVVVLSNIYASTPTTIGLDLAAIALGKTYAAARLLPGPLKDDAVARDAGSYKFGANFYQPNATLVLSVENRNALLHWPSAETTALVPVDGGEYIDRAYWMPVSFSRNADGAATELIYAGFLGQRLPPAN